MTNFPMPLNITIYDGLREILRSRISIANEYVLRIFLDEYKVADHLINLQRVYFFGAGDLMHTFYSKLFKSVSIYIYIIFQRHFIELYFHMHTRLYLFVSDEFGRRLE